MPSWFEQAGEALAGAFKWFTDLIANGFKTVFIAVVDLIAGRLGLELIKSSPETWTYKPPEPGKVGPFEGWVGGGLQYGTSILPGIAAGAAKGFADLGETVKAAVLPPFEDLTTDVFTALEAAIKPGSPPEALNKAIEKMAEALLARQQQLAHTEAKSIPEMAELSIRAVEVIAGNLGLAVGGLLAGVAIDQIHPIKNPGIRDMVADVLGSFYLPAVIGPFLAGPVSAAVLKPLQYRWNEAYPYTIPPVIDLIRFVIREVIPPEEFAKTMPFHGYSPYWAKAYWDAHWILVAFRDLVDAYHRGIITSEELDKFLVWHDYSPSPRPGIAKNDIEIVRGILKTPIPRVDLRRAWEMGVLTDEDLVERFRWLGYEDDSELMAEIQKRVALTAEIGDLRREAEKDYVDGLIDERTFRSNLIALGYSLAFIDYRAATVKQRASRDLKREQINILTDAYQKDLIPTEMELERRLKEIVVRPEVIESIIAIEYIRKYKKPKAS